MSSYTCIYRPDFVNLYYIFMMMFETSKHGCHRSGNSQGKKFFKVREKSGNFTLSQGKFTSLKKVSEK